MVFVLLYSNTKGVTSAAGTDNPSGHLSSSPVFSGGRVAQSLIFCVVVLLLLLLSVFLYSQPQRWCNGWRVRISVGTIHI